MKPFPTRVIRQEWKCPTEYVEEETTSTLIVENEDELKSVFRFVRRDTFHVVKHENGSYEVSGADMKCNWRFQRYMGRIVVWRWYSPESVETQKHPTMIIQMSVTL